MCQCIADINRLHLKGELARYGIVLGENKYNDFYRFITDIANTHHMQTYIIMCGGHFSAAQLTFKLAEIIDEFEFYRNDSYTYGQVIQKDPEWYDFFKENAFPCGRKKPHENRYGVSRSYVDDIMKIHDGFGVSLDDAIILWSSLKFKIFCIENITNPYYDKYC